MTQQSRKPKVTVLMPVFNGEQYLDDAIKSILGQSFSDFEFLIINDGSTDSSVEIIESYRDRRICLIQNGTNLKLIATLNKGLGLARGEYIARMDCDDISLPERLAKQVQFLDEHLDIGILGTNAEVIDSDGIPWPEFKQPCLPIEPGVIRWNLFFLCCIHHPTVMVRRTVYETLGGYGVDFPHVLGEDYDLWLRASREVRIANLPETLLKLRTHEDSVSHVYGHVQQKGAEFGVQKALSKALQREISLDRVRTLREPYSITVVEETIETAVILYELYRVCTKRTYVSPLEKEQIQNDATRRLGQLAIACAVLDRDKVYAPTMLDCLRSVVEGHVLDSEEWTTQVLRLTSSRASLLEVCRCMVTLQAMLRRWQTNPGYESQASHYGIEAMLIARFLVLMGHAQFANGHPWRALKLGLLSVLISPGVLREWGTLRLLAKGVMGQRLFWIARWGYGRWKAAASRRSHGHVAIPASAPERKPG